MRQLPWARLCLACMSAVDSCWVLTPSERAAAANAGDDVSAWPAANSGWSAALTRAVLTCSSPATAATIASWPCRSSAALEPAGAVLAPSGLCLAYGPWARLCLACMSAVDSCWVLTPSERAAAANAGDDVSAWPAANSGWSAALTRAVLTCSSLATAATIASCPGRSLADMVLAGAPGLPPVADAIAAVLPAARAVVTAAAAAIILVRLRMRILLGFVACTQREPGGTQAGRRSSLPRPKKQHRPQTWPSACAAPGQARGLSSTWQGRHWHLAE